MVIEDRVVQDFKTRTDGAAFGITRAVDEARDAGLDEGAGAHAAWFYRDVECCSRHAVVAEEASSFPDNDDLGVSGGVTVTNCTIAGAGEDFAVVDDKGADGDFACGSSGAGFL